MEVPDLAGPDLDAVVMELVPQGQASGVALIEADGDDGPAPAHDADRFVERACVPRAFERHRHGFAPQLTL